VTVARPRPAAGRQLWPLLELFALTGLVVAQPVLDVLGRAPDFLLFHEADARDIVAVALTITLLPPLALWGLELLAGLFGPRARAAAHLFLVAVLLGLLGLEAAKQLTPLRGPALATVALVSGGGGALLYVKAPPVRLWLRYLSPAPVVFLLVFLLVSPSAALLKAPPAAAVATSGVARRGEPGPIVVVLMDEFPLSSLLDRQGQVDRRLYPNFASLAAGSTWYRNSTAVVGMTGWALPALMTGRYPAEDRLPIASQFPYNMFTLLGGSYGYKMRVFEGMSQLCPPAICPDAKKSGLAAGESRGQPVGGFREVLRDSARLWTQITSTAEPIQNPEATLEEGSVDADAVAAGPDRTADPSRRAAVVKAYKRGIGFQRFLSSIRASGRGRRAVYFVHVLIPHQPWKYLPSGRTYPQRDFGAPLAVNGVWTSERWPVESSYQRHLLQAAVADRMLGDLVKRLRDTGLYDRSLLVVTADHGMSFQAGRDARANPDEGTAPDVLWVPTFIKRPDQRTGSVNDVNWEHVDLLPTIADIMRFDVPWRMDGVSWANPEVPARDRTEKWFYPHPGLRRVFNGQPNQTVVLRGVTDRLLRPQDGYLGWFRVGPDADLVGRRVDRLEVGAGGGTAQVSDLAAYRRIDPASGQVPAWVGGRLTATAPGIPPRPTVVAAVNGVIGGVSETFASGDSGPTWFSALVADSLMRPGDNHLQLFVLDTAGGGRRLRPLTLTP
jgi:hypothetical protein